MPRDTTYDLPPEMTAWLFETRKKFRSNAAMAKKVGIDKSSMGDYLNRVRTKVDFSTLVKFIRAFPELAQEPWFPRDARPCLQAAPATANLDAALQNNPTLRVVLREWSDMTDDNQVRLAGEVQRLAAHGRALKGLAIAQERGHGRRNETISDGEEHGEQ